jgi:hypothetical protein
MTLNLISSPLNISPVIAIKSGLPSVPFWIENSAACVQIPNKQRKNINSDSLVIDLIMIQWAIRNWLGYAKQQLLQHCLKWLLGSIHFAPLETGLNDFL